MEGLGDSTCLRWFAFEHCEQCNLEGGGGYGIFAFVRRIVTELEKDILLLPMSKHPRC